MQPRVLRNLYFLPIVMGVGLFTGMITCFLIALTEKHVSAYLPYISETGALLPESGILGLFLILGANFGIITMVTRFLIVAELNGGHLKKIDVINSLSLFVGFISLCGMFVVGVYPESGLFTAHAIGALILFIGSIAYAFLQTRLTYWMYPAFNGILICRIRLAISIICSLLVITMIILFPIGQSLWNAAHPKADKEPHDKGFPEILTSAVCEWLMATCFILFFFTYIREFQKVMIQISVTPLVNHFDEDVDSGRINGERLLD